MAASSSSAVRSNGQGVPETQTQQSERLWDIGPDLKSPMFLERGKSIFIFALENHLTQIIVMTIALLLLLIGIINWDVLLPPLHLQNMTAIPSARPTNWADWWMRVQSFLGLGTLFVALFVWYDGIREDWESQLPKRMSVFFFHEGRPAIVCRYVWLADADDLRAWGQQVAAQAADTERRLEFSPEIKTKNPGLIIEQRNNTICHHYTICFHLNSLPSSLINDPSQCRYQNFAAERNDVQPIPSDTIAALSPVLDWKK